MTSYAVIDPATGKTVEEYATITDDELRAAIGRADEAHRTWSASSSVSDRAALVRRVGRAASRAASGAGGDHRAGDGQADRAGARRGRLLR